MQMVAISILNEDEGIRKIIDLMRDNLLIPFFGTGMTWGEQAKKFTVPNADESTKLMKDLIIKHRSDLKDDLKNLDFNNTANFFFKCVPQEDRDVFFRDYFTEVTITGERKEIINFDWPYGYTLNIDDGIEKSSHFTPVYPYIKTKRPTTEVSLLYKIHGDAYNEITYELKENIVFSYKQYIKVLKSDKNKDFLNFIRSDFIQKNIIYLGCSLRDEKDLAIIFDEISDKVLSNNRIILKDYDISESEKLSLEDYGINTVIRVSDYRTFFEKWISIYKKEQASKKAVEYKYKNPGVDILSNKDEAIDAFCDNTYFDSINNKFVISDILIERKVFRELSKKINTNSCFFILGRRLSGKTAILSSICKSMKGYSHILFPSRITCDERTVAELLHLSNNTLFLFDSNSLSSSAYRTVANGLDEVSKNNNKIIFFSNSDDNFMAEHLNAEQIIIDNRFDKKNDNENYNELNEFNEKANRYGLNKRRSSDSNLDYLNYIHESQKINTKIDSIINKKLTLEEKIIFILLCAHDKVYYSDLFPFGIYTNDIENIVKTFPYLLEIEKTSRSEIPSHSSHKIVHNSKCILINKLRELDSDDIRYCIEYIVKNFYKNRSKFRLYIEVILFDTLNQIFGNRSGAGKLIYSVYERLESILNYDLHYWLQRAKSIYRLFPKKYDMLKCAYQYAKKVYCDTQENTTLHLKGALSTSITSSLIYFIEKNTSEKKLLQREIIMLSYEVIFSHHFNNPRTGLKHALNVSINSRNTFEMINSICNEYIRAEPYGDLNMKANKIITELKKSINTHR